ncbi:MAG: RNA-binding S4 domain-containing protein [SAR324 cluster bacterium]|nr:RNA-binding S4 domain-containing protein [SAR324 cluster bacterium]MBL7035399.1 RNA-binding S4 domain-containing protein [SAR324 cluster bacterium]
MNLQHCVKETESGIRLDQLLTSLDEIISRTQAQRLLKSGNVLVNGKSELAPSRKVREGQEILVTIPPPESTEVLPEKGNLDVLFEDSHLIVINKAAGVVVHPSAGHASGTLVNYLLDHCQDLSGIGGVLRPGIVHRIDKDTSGVLLVAKTDEAHQHLSAQFKSHSVKRQYQALVWGVPKTKHGVIDAALRRHPVRRKDISIIENDDSAENEDENEKKMGKSAVTHWRLLQGFEFAALLACRLETGRTHQIRVHLTSIGHPLIGDPQYGKSPLKRLSHLSAELSLNLKNFKRQALHAEILGFEHPVSGEWLEFKAVFPEDFRNLLTAIQHD